MSRGYVFSHPQCALCANGHVGLVLGPGGQQDDSPGLLQGAGTNDYGDRASRDLIVTRGAGFRKEKNKKKRGSYRGGEITVSFSTVLLDTAMSNLHSS